jgi:hypothetical protein
VRSYMVDNTVYVTVRPDQIGDLLDAVSKRAPIRSAGSNSTWKTRPLPCRLPQGGGSRCPGDQEMAAGESAWGSTDDEHLRRQPPRPVYD